MNMATASKNSPSEDARSLVECPVCVATFRTPKSLRCGHSVCFECCEQLRTALHIMCPVCRTRTTIPPEGLPTNFALQDLVEHHMTRQEGKKYTCSLCERRQPIEELWTCSTCTSALICANCAIKDHRGHELQMVSDMISRRREELADWRQRMENIIREVDSRRRQIDANLVRIEQRSIQLNGTLRTKLEPWFSGAVMEMNTDRDELFKAIHDVDVADIIGVNSDSTDPTVAQSHNQYQNQLNEVPQKLDALKTKQDKILADQRLALEIVQNCNEVLGQIVSSSDRSSGKQQQEQSRNETGPSSGATAAVVSPIRWQPGRSYGRIRGRLLNNEHHLGRGRGLFEPLGPSGNDTQHQFSAHFSRPADGPMVRRFTLRVGMDDGARGDDAMDDGASHFLFGIGDGPVMLEDESAPAVQMESSEPGIQPVQPIWTSSTAPHRGLWGRRSGGANRRGGTASRVPHNQFTIGSEMEVTSDDEADSMRASGGCPGVRMSGRRGALAGYGRGERLVLRPSATRGRGRTGGERFQPVGGNIAPTSAGDTHPTTTTGPSTGQQRQVQQNQAGNSGQQGMNGGDTAGESGAGGASDNINVVGRIRFMPSDSSDDDVTDAILFHTFLPPSSGSDRNKRQH